MYGRLLILACAAIASAKFHINEFAGKTCDLLDIWNRNTNTSSSVQYTQDNNEHSFLLSNDCQGQLKSILTNCLDSSRLKCNNILLSISDESPADESISRRALAKRLQSGQSHPESCSYVVSDLSIAKSSEIASSPSVTSGALDLTQPMTSTIVDKIDLESGGKLSTAYTLAMVSTRHLKPVSSYSQTRGSMEAMKTSIGRICLIKESEYYAAGKGGKSAKTTSAMESFH
ncbi:hypothetical protein PENARI_c048G05153 [Penicillium arizonense]|uniref:Uncharacterized protein n=1 Tax=Penicillium arizonense TaxID=1835702 RepID=A0A1F5L2C5_PENAI|nr:hypothetical protein PENARI_c048G05153 [Penicillium arizonense]OGE47354.1 hypothetical protein PENARI_c048G05153 [Penicillium arizonense]